MKYLNSTILLTALFVMGCNSATKKQEAEINQQVQEQQPANTPEKIAEHASEAFSKAEGLTETQRQKLMMIYAQTYTAAMDIRTEIGKSKALLFKKAADVNYKSNEIEILKKKIVDLDQKRLKLMFNALAEVQDIVGYGKDREQIYKHFYDYEIPRGTLRQM